MIVVLTGPSGCGKTTVCQRTAQLAREAGRSVAGLLTLRRLADGQAVGLDVVDLSTGDRRALAERDRPTDGPATDHWHFHRGAVAWGSERIERIGQVDLLIVDELGPLELVRGEGWRGAIGALATGPDRLGLAVVRPALVGRFVEDVGDRAPVSVVTVSPDTRDGLAASIVARLGGGA